MKFPPYQEAFINGMKVPFPTVAHYKTEIAPVKNNKKNFLEYEHYSCVMHKTRRLAILSACNIDGHSTADIKRTGDFVSDDRVDAAHQTATSFYDGRNNIFDKGHLTKYTDVLWGTKVKTDLRALGDSTFHYPNAVPQHHTLNRGMWSSLEKYILDTETDALNLKICLFTGPMLLASDPFLKAKVEGLYYQLPMLFWKVVIFPHQSKLHAVAFVMSHQSLVKKEKVLKPAKNVMKTIAMKAPGDPAFMDYKHSVPYQVSVEFIEKMTGIKFRPAKLVFPFKETRPLELIADKVDVIKKKEKHLLAKHDQKILEIVKKKKKPRSEYMFENITLT